jgi:hypothetical protein
MKRFVSRVARAARGTGCLALAFALAGCKGLDDPATDARCTITISGAAAIAGTYTCSQPAVSIWVASTNVGAVSLNIASAKSITGLFVFPGQPTVGVTYSTEKNPANLQSYGFIVAVGTSTWEFSAGQQKMPLGSGSLTFSSVVAGLPGTSGTTFVTHGTIDANLVPSPGTPASGNATMHIDF